MNREKFDNEFRSGLRMFNVGGSRSENIVGERVDSAGKGENYQVKVFDVEKLNLDGIEKMVESLPKEYFKC